ncbi:hypothetical protein MMC26_002006 [Xylographa opegraphella]|nr:hypothetical protein [Xylographa opegraphella]
MGSLRYNDYSDSPTIFLPSHHQSFTPVSHHSHQQQMSAYPFQPQPSHSSEWTPAASSKPVLTTNPSFKRSRDEVDSDEADSDQSSPFTMSNPITPHEPMPERLVYSEGMTVINASTGRAISAETQTGTWYEENLEIERQASIKAAESVAQTAGNVSIRPKKSLRLDNLPPAFHSSSSPSPDNISLDSQSSSDLCYDAASLLLGVGWKSIGEEKDTQAAAKGWAKYIENHYYDLANVHLLMKSEAHQAYLGKADMAGSGSFFLFSEDLSEGRFVAQTWKDCIMNLKITPIVYGSEEILKAHRTPMFVESDRREFGLTVPDFQLSKSDDRMDTD